MMPSDPGLQSFIFIFTLGYLLCLMTPGPNFVLVAGVAVARGLKGTWGVCWGVTIGSLLLSAALFFLSELLPEGRVVNMAAHIMSALLLISIAWRLLRRRGAASPIPQHADFGMGLCTSLVNPITGAYFASQFLAMPSGTTKVDQLMLFAIIAGVAFVRSIAIAALFGSWSVGLARLRTSQWPCQVGGIIFLMFAAVALWSAARDMV